jgi:hypothetical protein
VLDVFVSEVGLQRPGVVSPVGQRIAAGVPEHVDVNLEWKTALTDALDQAIDGIRRNGVPRSVSKI